MRARDAHLSLHSRSFANQSREVIEHLGKIAAGFPLSQHGGNEEPGVEKWHTRRETLEGVG